jgi:hypothetical protein
MSGDGRKGLYVLATTMALILGGLIYFLFVVHPSETPETDSASRPESSNSAMPASPRLLAAQPALASDEADLCGYGRVKRSVVEDLQVKARVAADKALSRFAAGLTASKNESDSALGLFLQESLSGKSLDELQDCGKAESCGRGMTAPSAEQAAAIQGSLVRLASSGRNPQAYALAFQSCGYRTGPGAEGSCALLSAERWAQIEPDNGVPWLLLASTAQAANDLAGRDTAVVRASAARRFDAHLPNFLGLLQSPQIQAETPQIRAALAEDLLGLETTRPAMPYSAFLRFCNYPSTADTGRLKVCGDLANLLLNHDQTLIGLGTGLRLAQSAGSPPERLNTLREEKKALDLAAQKQTQETGEGVTCQEITRFEQWAADYAQLGDRGVATKFLEKNGLATSHPLK